MDRKWWTLFTVCIGTFMLLLDITVVTVALPAIQAALHSSFSDLQWVVDAYSLTLASFLLTAGVIGDMYGRRGVYAAGLGIFTVSSLVCGLSTSPLMLDLARGAQGLGAAIMFATGLALIAQAFSGKERGTAFGIYGAVLGGALAIGPLVGGAVTSGVGWRWIFFLNLPLGAVGIGVALSKVPESQMRVRRRIDWAGFLSFSAALFMLVFALLQGNNRGWGSTTIVSLFAGSGVLMAMFLVAEWRQHDPMLDLSLFKRPAMSGVSLAAFTLSASIFAMFLYVTLYLQDVLGYSPFGAGIRFLPITVLSFILAPLAGRLSVRVQSRYLLSLGLLFVAFGCDLMTRVRADSTWTVLLPGFIVAGVGVGLTNPVLASATVSVVPAERSGMASGSSSTFRQVGIATGIAGLGAVFVSQIGPGTIDALATTFPGLQVLAQGGGVRAAISQGVVRQAVGTLPTAATRHALTGAYQSAFASTFNHLMGISTVVAAIGALGSLALVRQRDFVPSINPHDLAPSQQTDGSGASVITPGGGTAPFPSEPPAHARRPAG